MNQRLISTDSPLEGTSGSIGPIDYLTHECSDPAEITADNQEVSHDINLLHNAISKLDKRSQSIIFERWLKPQNGSKSKTLKEIASELNISAERVRQIESNALKNLKKYIDCDRA